MMTWTGTVERRGFDIGARRRRAFVEAQYALGERMYGAGIDDGQIGEQIAALDMKIAQQGSSRGAWQALLTERRQLIRELASAALAEEGPLPGAEVEYRQARRAQTALRDQVKRQTTTTAVSAAR